MITNVQNFFYGMINAFQSVTAVLVIVGGLAGVIGVLFFSMLILRKINASFAIIFSTVLSCILMLPVISSFNNLIKIRVEGAMIDETRAEIRAARAEAARLQAENQVRNLERERLNNQITIAKQTIEMEALNDSIKVLEHAQLSMQSFQRILELALLETNLKQTMVRKDPITQPEGGWGIRADYYYDEVLVIMTHDIGAKFGVNLNEIRISRIDGNTAVVSGIRPIFIGASRNIADTLVQEIRRVNIKNRVVDTVVIDNSSNAKTRANNYAGTYATEFQTRLSRGTELGFMDDAVIQLAQNFITVMLTPLFRTIRFDNAYRADALPIMAYLENEIRENNSRKAELNEINGGLTKANEQIGSEIEKIGSSIPEDTEMEETADDAADGDAA